MHIKFKIIYKEGISTPQAPVHEEHDPSLPSLYLILGTYLTAKHTIVKRLRHQK